MTSPGGQNAGGLTTSARAGPGAATSAATNAMLHGKNEPPFCFDIRSRFARAPARTQGRARAEALATRDRPAITTEETLPEGTAPDEGAKCIARAPRS